MNSSNKVVRYHRRLRDIAPSTGERVNQRLLNSNAAGPDNAERRVLAAWLPLISIARAVMCAMQDERHQSEPGGKHLPGISSPPRLRRMHAPSVVRRSKNGHAVSAETACLLRLLN